MRATVAGLGLILASAAAGELAAQDQRTTLDSVYTAEQAAEGKAVYQRVCSSCHTLDWYQGEALRAWDGASVYGLFEIILVGMPQDNPGSLPRKSYVDVLAYILELNGLPAGETPLPSGRSSLNAILFKFDEMENR